MTAQLTLQLTWIRCAVHKSSTTVRLTSETADTHIPACLDMRRNPLQNDAQATTCEAPGQIPCLVC